MSNKMDLFIDTTKDQTSEVKVVIGQKTDYKAWSVEAQTTDTVLQQVNLLLQQNKAGFRDLTKITVDVGPGTRFSRTRLGVTIANAIGFACQIPVNNKTFATPIYAKEPNISKPKHKL